MKTLRYKPYFEYGLFGNEPVGFSLLTKTLRQTASDTQCREALCSDLMGITHTTLGKYQPIRGVLYLLVRVRPNRRYKERKMKKIETYINRFQKELGIKKKIEVYKTQKKENFIFKLSPVWSNTTQMLSLISYIIRICWRKLCRNPKEELISKKVLRGVGGEKKIEEFYSGKTKNKNIITLKECKKAMKKFAHIPGFRSGIKSAINGTFAQYIDIQSILNCNIRNY